MSVERNGSVFLLHCVTVLIVYSASGHANGSWINRKASDRKKREINRLLLHVCVAKLPS